MSGRSFYNKYSVIIEVLVKIFSFLPSPVLRYAYCFFKILEGPFGLLGRYLIVRNLCASCGRIVMIGPRVTIKSFEGLSIGERVNVHEGVYIDAVGGVSIGDDSSVGHGSSILSFEHQWDDLSVAMKYNPLRTAPVKIGNNVIVSCGSRVLSGASLGDRTFIAAGCVVTSGEYCSALYGGVPAKKLKAL